MNYTKPHDSTEISTEIGMTLEMEMEENVRVLPRVRAPAIDDGGSSAESLNELLVRVSETSKREIDDLIDELHTLRIKLQSDTDRIQSEIATYAAMSDQVMQLTKIISESMHKLPDAPTITA
jgi:methyl-accepting chemotaxis protein